jgi:hypothetical protein
MTYNKQTNLSDSFSTTSPVHGNIPSDFLIDEAADAPLNPYARVFVVSWLLGTLLAVGVPHLMQ